MAESAFPNYMQLRGSSSPLLWRVLRILSVSFALALCAVLVVAPGTGLTIWWKVLVPLLPAVFFFAPGLWRNVCPLAALNQVPRTLGVTRARRAPRVIREHGHLIAMVAFVVLVAARKPLFNGSGVATAALILGALGLALTGGLIFNGKSGWCGSICPLLPVQRLYGQTPFATVANQHCNPCVGCTKNCYDFNPRVAYLADVHDRDRRFGGYRVLFAAAFPGLIVGFYVTAKPGGWGSAAAMAAQMAVALFVSIGVFHAVQTFTQATAQQLTAVFGAAAINLYYGFTLNSLFGGAVLVAALFAVQLPLLAATAVWLRRTFRKEGTFLAEVAAPPEIRFEQSKVLPMHEADAAGRPEVTFVADDRTVVVKPGATLLEVAEASDLPIESGCRMGMCGADPVTVVSGIECLSRVTDDERTTLERLGAGTNVRMACCARVHGSVCVALGAGTEAGARAVTPAGTGGDPAIRRVVVIGNGVAGLTAADHVRRLHRDCEVALVAAEPHHFYNRMAITRLIYGRSAMAGLYLLPDEWYAQNRITPWLNTTARAIDASARTVELGTGEQLEYDRLILAMGARSHVPELPGFGTPGSFVLRTAEDAMRVRSFAQQEGCRRAVIVGGGPLGLEAAYALHKFGMRVVVLERSDRLLRRNLDQRASTLLHDYLHGLGVEVAFGAEATAVDRRNGSLAVALASGDELPADMLLVCAGSRPNTGLAERAGLEVGVGILVDEHMRTTAPDVFAAGDVTEHDRRLCGLWPTAVGQAEVAAANAVGEQRTYRDSLPALILKVSGIHVAAAGACQAEDASEVIVLRDDPHEQRYLKVMVNGGVLTGAVAINCPEAAAALTAAVRDRAEVAAELDALREGRWQNLAAC
jgi:NADPH-dependent 2,4-dienoyl-CoA reductase/sulfur reductase-like enzyme/ferredoxin